MRRLAVILLALAAGAAAFGISLMAPVQGGRPYTVNFVVLPGESLHQIAVSLQSLGLVREHHAFEAAAVLRGEASKLKAGPYRASSDEWAWEILERLAHGDVTDTSVTVPEGLWTAEVAKIVGPWVAGGADSFLAAARDSVLLRKLGVPGGDAEGYLFPNSYRVVPGSAAREVVRIMVEEFFRRWRESLAGRARERGMGMTEVVTLASIVEAEAKVPDERPRIAAVYLNRLERGYPLQADPTVLYALGERKPRTLYSDLEDESPYNTYRHAGLPPGPSITRAWRRCGRCCGRRRTAGTCTSWRGGTGGTCSPPISRPTAGIAGW